MKTVFFLPLILSFFLLFSCDKKTKVEKAVEEIPVQIKVNRFDKVFFETAQQDLPQLKQEYPFFFPAGNDDSVWLEKMQHPQWQELYTEVQKLYANFDGKTAEIEDLFKHIKNTKGLYGHFRNGLPKQSNLYQGNAHYFS